MGAFGSVISRIRGGWWKFRDIVSSLADRGLPSRVKARLCSAFGHSNMP